MYVSCILLAAGKGLRFNSRIPKPLVRLRGRPILIHSLLVLNQDPSIREIILVANPLNQDAIKAKIRHYGITKFKAITLGGRLRKDSLAAGLALVSPRAELVAIHDACRPFITSKLVAAVIKEASKSKAAILAVPVKATIKTGVRCQVSGVRKVIVAKTLERDNLWEAQTPQVFQRNLILEGYRKFGHCPVTDDAMLVEKMGKKVSVVKGSYENIKITTPEDLTIAEAIAKKYSKY